MTISEWVLLADLANLVGVSRQTIYRLEAGRVDSLETLQRVADALGLKLSVKLEEK